MSLLIWTQEKSRVILYQMCKQIIFTLIIFIRFIPGYAQENCELFAEKNDPSFEYRNMTGKYKSLILDHERLGRLFQQSPDILRLTLPFENNDLQLELKKTTITADSFVVKEALAGESRRTVNYTAGVFYQGKIKDKTSSFATICIFKDRVMGIIADQEGNIVLGALEEYGKAADEYVLYREKDLNISNSFSCHTPDGPFPPVVKKLPNGNPTRISAIGEPVDIYIESDYQLYLDKGSNTNNVVNYILGLFNNVALLYENENIKIQVSEILVWTSADPETVAQLNSAGEMLPSFMNRLGTGTFNGDYAHFLTTRTQSGMGYILDDPCDGPLPKQFRSAVSGITTIYSNFPVYSFSVYIMAHELGHNFGSQHTHWCGWPVGALDNCNPASGSCSGSPPVTGGTIMSYCQNTTYGVNFNNGFGFYPGNKIRSVIGAAACLGACRMTIEITKTDATCGQQNGSATITATNNTGNVTYTWSNGQTGNTLSNAGPGIYNVMIRDEAGCQVMGQLQLTNYGPVMDVELSPSGITGFCAGNTVLLSTPPNNNYSYQWYKNGTEIPGAILNSFLAESTGIYSVNVMQDPCVITRSAHLIEVIHPVAAITPSDSVSFCKNESNLLNAYAGPGYTYQWYRNEMPVADATDSVYAVHESGNYTVKLSATGCESVSEPVHVTVNETPESIITLNGNSNFCQGKNVTLFASYNTAGTYHWYKNNTSIPAATGNSLTATTSGIYTVLITQGSCSGLSDPVTLTLLDTPVIMVNPAVSSIRKFQTQTLTASGAAAYNWAIQPDLVSYTQNSAILRPLSSTSYVIEGTSNNGCKASVTALVTVRGCGDITNISSLGLSPSRVLIRWKNPEGTITDSLHYRKAGTSLWTSILVTGEMYELNQLEPGTTYEYSISPLCATTDSLPSEISTFSTPQLENDLFTRLYPNPVHSTAFFEIIYNKPFSLQLFLYDSYGRMVKQISSKENAGAGQVIKEINTESLAAAIYYLVAQINDTRHVIKMSVAR